MINKILTRFLQFKISNHFKIKNNMPMISNTIL